MSHRILSDVDITPRDSTAADYRKSSSILGILTADSFTEGVAISIPLQAMRVSKSRMVW